MMKVFAHIGPYQDIPPDSSRGLRFLKELLPALDSILPTTSPISRYLTPNARFILNGGDPAPEATVTAMMTMRSQKLQAFCHKVKAAWDLEQEDGKRTVMYEAVSVTLLKVDEEDKAIEVPEFNIVELQPMEGGVEGLGAYELRVYMDAQSVMQGLKQTGKHNA
jgi:hypothetical protein